MVVKHGASASLNTAGQGAVTFVYVDSTLKVGLITFKMQNI